MGKGTLRVSCATWLQVMALVAMEQPLSFGAEHIRTEKLKVLQACKPLSLDDVVTGQYTGCGGRKVREDGWSLCSMTIAIDRHHDSFSS